MGYVIRGFLRSRPGRGRAGEDYIEPYKVAKLVGYAETQRITPEEAFSARVHDYRGVE